MPPPAISADRTRGGRGAQQTATSPAIGWPWGNTSQDGGPGGRRRHWRLPTTERSVTVLRRALDAFLGEAGLFTRQTDEVQVDDNQRGEGHHSERGVAGDQLGHRRGRSSPPPGSGRWADDVSRGGVPGTDARTAPPTGRSRRPRGARRRGRRSPRG